MQLVLIGTGELGVNEAHDRLAAAIAAASAVASEDTDADGSADTMQQGFASLTDRIRAHDLFTVQEAAVDTTQAHECTGTSSVLFRLTGAQRCGCGVDELRDRWHVDLSRLNAQLLAAVNSDAGPAFLSPVKVPSTVQAAEAASGAAGRGKSELWLRHALGGKMSMADWWEKCVVREAESIVKRNPAMQAALGAGVACPKGEASLHMMEVGRMAQNKR